MGSHALEMPSAIPCSLSASKSALLPKLSRPIAVNTAPGSPLCVPPEVFRTVKESSVRPSGVGVAVTCMDPQKFITTPVVQNEPHSRVSARALVSGARNAAASDAHPNNLFMAEFLKKAVG
jgi:hypothetical protein